MRPSVTSKELEKRRLRAVEAVLKDQLTVAAVAKRFKVYLRTLYLWLARYRQYGHPGIAARPAPGAPKKLQEKDLKRLEKKILKGAKAAGFPNDLWTCARIRDLIKKEFGVDYHFNHVGKLLARMGWSPQRPTKQAIERDDRRIRHWVKVEMPRIKKKPAN